MWKYGRLLRWLAAIPALVLGAMIMDRNSIGPSIYLQNGLCYVVLTGVILGIMRSVRISDTVRGMLLGAGVLLLSLTFVDRGLEGVHRWVGISGLRLYIAAIVLPVMLVGFERQLHEGRIVLPVTLITLCAGALVLQPDAAQLTAFAVAAGLLAVILLPKQWLRLALPVLLIGACIYGWVQLDTLAPVAHVEGILELAWEMGAVWGVLAAIALVVMVLPFFIGQDSGIASRTVGLYFIICIMASCFGAFPVPLLGFGVSPVIGYVLAIGALEAQNKKTMTT